MKIDFIWDGFNTMKAIEVLSELLKDANNTCGKVDFNTCGFDHIEPYGYLPNFEGSFRFAKNPDTNLLDILVKKGSQEIIITKRDNINRVIGKHFPKETN